MSEIHVGDTVRVSYEAPVTKLTPSTVEVTDVTHGRKIFLRSEAELVTPPLPTQLGAIIQSAGKLWVFDGTHWCHKSGILNPGTIVNTDFRVIRVGIENDS